MQAAPPPARPKAGARKQLREACVLATSNFIDQPKRKTTTMSNTTTRINWTGEAVLDAIAEASPPAWLAAFDDTDLQSASRPELLALLASAPNATAAGFLAGVITQRNFH